MPAATVRSRQKRGLESLRERLDRRSGSRAGWMAALVPFTRSELGAPAALFASVTTLIAMKFALVGLCVVLALVLAWPLFERGPSSDTSTSAAARAVAPTAADADTMLAALEGGAAAREVALGEIPIEKAAPKPAEVPFHVRARALDGSGNPLPRGWLDLPRSSQRVARAGPDGRLALELDPSSLGEAEILDGSRRLVVRVGALGHRSEQRTAYALAGSHELDLGDVALEPGAALEGRVLDPGGVGVQGARVVFGKPLLDAQRANVLAEQGPSELGSNPMLGEQPAWTATSALDGSFRIEGLPAGYGTLWARTDESRWSWSEPIGLRAGDEHAGAEIVVRAQPDAVISGRVLDPDGAPVADLKLVFQASDVDSGWWDVRTDLHGRFHHVPWEGRAMDLHATAPHQDWNDLGRAAIAPGSHGLELVFERARWWDVEVRAGDGSALRDGKVQGLAAEGPTDAALPRMEATLDAQGRARLRRWDSGLRVRVSAPGYRARVVGPFEPATFPDPLVVELEQLPALVGRVLGVDGTPAAGARVALHRGVEPSERAPGSEHVTQQSWGGDGEAPVLRLLNEPLSQATADAEGRYRLPLPGIDAKAADEVAREEPMGFFGTSDATTRLAKSGPETPWFVHAALDGPGVTSGPHRFDGTGEVELDVRLEPVGSVAGTLALEDGRSAAGWTMVASDALAGSAIAPVAGDGSFRFDGLHAGGWQVRAFEPGKRVFLRSSMLTPRVPEPDVEVVAGAATGYVHRTRPRAAARLAGRLLVDGSAPGAWHVIVRTATKHMGITSHELTLDPDGRFAVQVEPERDATLLIFGDLGGSRFSLTAKPAIHSGLQEWSFAFATARLEGRISPVPPRSRPGMPTPRYVVEGQDVRIDAQIEVDETGRFGPVPVAAGRGQLLGSRADWRDPAPIWAELDLAPGETRTLDLR